VWLASTAVVSCTALGVAGDDHLRARPPVPGTEPAPAAAPGISEPGLQPLDLGGNRSALLYVPSTYRSDHPAPLVVMLHGAGGDPQGGLDPFVRLADDKGLILLAPASGGPTWDVVMGRYGPDVRSIDHALERIFARYRVDSSRLAIEGFSDGASYALSLGLSNGDLFTHVIAFSPGFRVSGTRRGAPRVFISHGRQDPVLPIASTSRRIVPKLEEDGYDVTYREFDGPHSVPPSLAEEALAWLLSTG
jgi:predicted esterase